MVIFVFFDSDREDESPLIRHRPTGAAPPLAVGSLLVNETVNVVAGRVPSLDATDSDCGLVTGESMAETHTGADLATAYVVTPMGPIGSKTT